MTPDFPTSFGSPVSGNLPRAAMKRGSGFPSWPSSSGSGSIFSGDMIGALVSGGLGLVGNIINNEANKRQMREYNRAQMELAQQNHNWNLDMLRKEQQFSVDMWNAQNEYNSPVQQVQRYSDAGLNPYLMMSPGDAGIAQSASTPSGNPTAAPNIMPFEYKGIGESVQSSVQSVFDALSLEKDLEMKDAQIASMSFDNLLKAQQTAFSQRQLDLFNDTYNYQKGSAFQDLESRNLANQKAANELPYVGQIAAAQGMKLANDAHIASAAVVAQGLENRIKEKNLEYLGQQYEAQISLLFAEKYAQVQAGNLSAATAARQVADTIIDQADRDDRQALNSLLYDEKWLENMFNDATFANRLLGTLPTGFQNSGLSLQLIAGGIGDLLSGGNFTNQSHFPSSNPIRNRYRDSLRIRFKKKLPKFLRK